MKKIGILVLFLSFGAISYAQSLRDKFFLGGSLGLAFTSEKYEESSPSVNPDTYRYFEVNPSFGFYLSDKWALGLMAGVQSSTRKNTESYVYFVQGIYTQGQFIEIQKDRSFRVAPFIRYTKFITEKFAFNLDFAIPCSIGKNYYTTEQQSSLQDGLKYQSIGISVNPELQFFASNKIAINASFGGLNYSYKKSRYKNTTYNNAKNPEIINSNFNLNLTTGLQIGVSFFFGGSK